MARKGRERILTEEVIKKFSDAIYLGATKKLAADYAGISVSSVMKWQELGEQEQERINKGRKPRKTFMLYLQFLQSMNSSQADLGIELLQEIQDARQKSKDVGSSWRMLTAKYREFSARQDIDMTSNGLPSDAPRLSDEEKMRRLLALTRKANA